MLATPGPIALVKLLRHQLAALKKLLPFRFPVDLALEQ